jgi:hypothetical protein
MKYGMKIFGTIMIVHWLEHLFQAYQVYVLHMNRTCALGMLGMKYPWLIRTESLHFVFALLTFAGMIYAGRHYFESEFAGKTWVLGLFAAAWHGFEHLVLFLQAATHTYFFDRTEPTTIIQLVVPRIELHLFYNSIITILALTALAKEYLYRDAIDFAAKHKEHCGFCIDRDAITRKLNGDD